MKISPWKLIFLLETIISRFRVNFWGCSCFFPLSLSAFLQIFPRCHYWEFLQQFIRLMEENLHQLICSLTEVYPIVYKAYYICIPIGAGFQKPSTGMSRKPGVSRIAGKCLFGIGTEQRDPHPSVNRGPPLLQLMHEPSGERSNTANTVKTSVVEDQCVETHKPFSFRKKRLMLGISPPFSPAPLICVVQWPPTTRRSNIWSEAVVVHAIFSPELQSQPPSLGGFRKSFKQPCPWVEGQPGWGGRCHWNMFVQGILPLPGLLPKTAVTISDTPCHPL